MFPFVPGVSLAMANETLLIDSPVFTLPSEKTVKLTTGAPVTVTGVVVTSGGTTTVPGSPRALQPVSTASLSGRALLQRPSDASGTTVTVSGVDLRGGSVTRTATTAASGAWSVTGLLAGSYQVTFGYTGPFTATPRGLIPAAVSPGTVAQDPDQTFDPADPTGTTAIPVVIPAGTTHARFSLFDADVAAGSDIDLYVYNSSGQLVGTSGSGTSAEEVNLSNPPAGNYVVYVHGWGLPAPSSPFKLNTWLLGSADAGNMTVTAPAAAATGQSGTVSISTNGLAPATKYLGSIAYGGIAGMPNPTIVRIDTP